MVVVRGLYQGSRTRGYVWSSGEEGNATGSWSVLSFPPWRDLIRELVSDWFIGDNRHLSMEMGPPEPGVSES